MIDRYFVIAGNEEQYRHFVRDKSHEMWQSGHTSITLSHFLYVSDATRFRGYRNPSGWFIGTWYERPDAYDILQQLVISMDDNQKIEVIRKQLKVLSGFQKISEVPV